MMKDWPEGKAIRLLIVDDHEVVRIGLRTVLQKHGDIEIVGEADTVQSAVSEASRLLPDVVLLDIRLPDGSGFEACRKMQELPGDTRVLILTSVADDETVYEAIQAGADGYVLKEINPDGLAQAIRQVARGQSVLDPAVTARVLSRVRSVASNDPQNKLSLLSQQEKRVLALVAEGKTNKEIAMELGLSDKTVKNYFSNLLGKLNLSRRSQAAVFFAQHRSR